MNARFGAVKFFFEMTVVAFRAIGSILPFFNVRNFRYAKLLKIMEGLPLFVSVNEKFIATTSKHFTKKEIVKYISSALCTSSRWTNHKEMLCDSQVSIRISE